jgi:mono/diheme cytochrome c family protein
MLKTFLLVSAVIFFVIAIAFTPWPAIAPALAAGHGTQDAAPAQSAPSATNPVRPTADSQARAKKMFVVDCAVCHGDNGNGKTDLAKDMDLTLQDWTDPKSLASKSDKELFEMIRNGKDKMPPEDASRAKDVDVWNLVIYIRGMSKGQGAAKPATN